MHHLTVARLAAKSCFDLPSSNPRLGSQLTATHGNFCRRKKRRSVSLIESQSLEAQHLGHPLLSFVWTASTLPPLLCPATRRSEGLTPPLGHQTRGLLGRCQSGTTNVNRRAAIAPVHGPRLLTEGTESSVKVLQGTKAVLDKPPITGQRLKGSRQGSRPWGVVSSSPSKFCHFQLAAAGRSETVMQRGSSRTSETTH